MSRKSRIPAGSPTETERQPAPAASNATAPAGATDAVSAVPSAGEGPEDGQPQSAAVEPVAMASATDLSTHATGTPANGATSFTPAETLVPWPLDAQQEDDTITITVIGPPKGMRRAGFHFNSAPQVITVTADQLRQIEADKMLAVSRGGQAEAPQPVPGRSTDALVDAEGRPKAITVLGPVKGIRRAGFVFGAQAVTITPTPEQLAAIVADPALAVMPA